MLGGALQNSALFHEIYQPNTVDLNTDKQIACKYARVCKVKPKNTFFFFVFFNVKPNFNKIREIQALDI